ncbi:MAG: VWA domain-containing protein [Ilumatobacteraceae bacterium]
MSLDATGHPAPTRAEAMAVAFARVLRGTGLAVPTSTVLNFAAALGAVGLSSRHDVYWAARATLVRNPEDFGVFDRAFRVFWDDAQPSGEPDEEPEPLQVTLAVDTDEGDDDGPETAEPSEDPTIELRFSIAEVLRHKDFAAYDDVELAEAHRVMHRMRSTGSPRRSLRLAPTTRRTARPDLRRTVRAALRTEGEAVRRHYRTPSMRHRRLVLLLDVSGSMEPYARALLRFVQAAVAGRRRVEAFALGTRLTRITRELGSRDPDIALRQAAGRVVDWSGGTRLGDGLRTFNDEWGVRGMARGAVVVILSDGWDRGEPEELAEQMQRLARVAHRVVWVNPLKVTPGYAPLARGMAAALPYVDRFVEGHSLDAMERLAAILDES